MSKKLISKKVPTYYEAMEQLAKARSEQTGEDQDLILLRALNDNTFRYEDYYNSLDDYMKEYTFPSIYNNAEVTESKYRTVYHPLFDINSIYSGKVSQNNPLGIQGGILEYPWTYTPSYDQIVNNYFDYNKTKEFLDKNKRSFININWDPNDKPSNYIKLNTYYPIYSESYPLTGHSSLSLKGLTERHDGKASYETRSVNKDMTDNNYNLIFNNCSDATRCALEKTFNKKINPVLFTTPGDVQDFALDELKGIPEIKDNLIFNPNTGKYEEVPEAMLRYKKRQKGKSTVYIPITKEQNRKLFKYIQNGNWNGDF